MAVIANVLILAILILSVSLTVHSDEEAVEDEIFETKLSDVVFVILSQPNVYHAKRARLTQVHMVEQVSHLSKEQRPNIMATHKKWPVLGAWTLFPLLKSWVDLYQEKKWIFVCDEETRVDMSKFEAFIQKYDPSKDWFLGRGLRDKEATIIHHFAPVNDLIFPDFAAGMAISMPLLKKLNARWPDNENFKVDFSIDPKHEFAKFVSMDNVKLTEVEELCSGNEHPGCVSTFPVKFPDCGGAVDEDDLFVAVKTCEKFHEERVPVVLNTWAKETSNIEFYSETEDPSIPTIDLGVPNTERGHCGKTMAIFNRAITEEHIKNSKWLLVADDDTIINIRRLRQLLACYDPSSNVALGERYGYLAASGRGYDYITGGGGMIFSLPVVRRLVEECKCNSNDSPDDMIIGMCLKRFGIPVTHVPYIHQARPDDYSEGYLSRQIPVSFHKHWNCDPYKIYKLLKEYDDGDDDDDDDTARDSKKASTTSDTGHIHDDL